MQHLNIPRLIGVRHKLIHLDETIETLKQFDLKNKRVMLEISDYPIPERHWGFDHEFSEFYDKIAKFVLEKNGIVIPGDSEILVDRAIQKLLSLTYQPYQPKLRYDLNNGPNLERKSDKNNSFINQDFGTLTDWIYCEERDPHFLQRITQTQPHIVILGEKHIQNLYKHLMPYIL